MHRFFVSQLVPPGIGWFGLGRGNVFFLDNTYHGCPRNLSPEFEQLKQEIDNTKGKNQHKLQRLIRQAEDGLDTAAAAEKRKIISPF